MRAEDAQLGRPGVGGDGRHDPGEERPRPAVRKRLEQVALAALLELLAGQALLARLLEMRERAGGDEESDQGQSPRPATESERERAGEDRAEPAAHGQRSAAVGQEAEERT